MITSTTREPAEKLKEIAVWYHENWKNTSDIDKRIEFLHRTVDHLIWFQTDMIEAIQNLEGRRNAQRILLPGGVRMEADLRTPGA